MDESALRLRASGMVKTRCGQSMRPRFLLTGRITFLTRFWFFMILVLLVDDFRLLRIVHDDARRGLRQLDLIGHLLQARGECSDFGLLLREGRRELLLLLRNCRFLLRGCSL